MPGYTPQQVEEEEEEENERALMRKRFRWTERQQQTAPASRLTEGLRQHGLTSEGRGKTLGTGEENNCEGEGSESSRRKPGAAAAHAPRGCSEPSRASRSQRSRLGQARGGCRAAGSRGAG